MTANNGPRKRDAKRDAKGSRGKNRERGTSDGGGLLATVAGAVRDGVEKIAGALSSDDSLDALALIKAQHRYVERLFATIERARGQAKTAAFAELADILAMHATIEEKIFYPGVDSPRTRAMLLEAAQEHLAMKRVLADMMAADADDPTFDSKLSVLAELVTHHAKEEEEGKLFPVIRAEQDPDFLAGLAGEMIALMVDLEQTGAPRTAVPTETGEAATI
jgi:hemerythrin superfamily protein